MDISEFRSCYLCSNYLKHKYCMRERNVLGFFFLYHGFKDNCKIPFESTDLKG